MSEDNGCKHEKVMPKIDITDKDLFALSDSEVRKKYPRFVGKCPDCDFDGIMYASYAHYIAGDW